MDKGCDGIGRVMRDVGWEEAVKSGGSHGGNVDAMGARARRKGSRDIGRDVRRW